MGLRLSAVYISIAVCPFTASWGDSLSVSNMRGSMGGLATNMMQ